MLLPAPGCLARPRARTARRPHRGAGRFHASVSIAQRSSYARRDRDPCVLDERAGRAAGLAVRALEPGRAGAERRAEPGGRPGPTPRRASRPTPAECRGGTPTSGRLAVAAAGRAKVLP